MTSVRTVSLDGFRGLGALAVLALVLSLAPLASEAEAQFNSARYITRNWSGSGQLTQGLDSNKVMFLQSTLNRFGFYTNDRLSGGGYITSDCNRTYDGAVDGNFGPCTTKAVKNYQKFHGLAIDGKIDSNDWTNLQSTHTTVQVNETPARCANGTMRNLETYACYYSSDLHPRSYSTKTYAFGTHDGIVFWHQTRSCWTAAKRSDTGACIRYEQDGSL